MRIVFSDPIPHRPGRDGLVAMTQDVADFFVATLARQPEDWHMMQRFFPADAGDPVPDASSAVRA
jgi:KDO2-lipid IV(A) lauroyltransferase